MIAMRLRRATDGDRDFLLEVYGSTRAAELALVDWDDATKRAFVEQQFEAQDSYYRRYYPGATFDVVMVDGEPSGRLYVDRWADEIRVIDIALLPAARGRGVGTTLLRSLMDEARAAGKPLTIHVEHGNPARRLYERLGFRPAGDEGQIHVLMRWEPVAVAS
jgi:GNAT superfamily N-acetyltransferase